VGGLESREMKADGQHQCQQSLASEVVTGRKKLVAFLDGYTSNSVGGSHLNARLEEKSL
jgi:hypothetical protein